MKASKRMGCLCCMHIGPAVFEAHPPARYECGTEKQGTELWAPCNLYFCLIDACDTIAWPDKTACIVASMYVCCEWSLLAGMRLQDDML